MLIINFTLRLAVRKTSPHPQLQLPIVLDHSFEDEERY